MKKDIEIIPDIDPKELSKDSEVLWDADPRCEHKIVCAPGGGIKCTKCNGWFCY